MRYLDTSAFLKLLVDEEHSAALREALIGQEVWSSTILAVEAHRAALQLGIDRSAVDLRLAGVTLIVPSESTFVSARAIGTSELRTFDALHLAAALELAADLDAVVTYDRRLAEGCDHEGVAVEAPGLASRWWLPG